MSFKLIAIRPLEGCSKKILKNLKEDEFYFFDNTYEPYKDNYSIIKCENIQNLPDNFYLKKNLNSTLKSLNVQAIVGKNGSGKSALAELLLGTLNNIFKYISKEIGNDIDLLFVKDLKIALYFELDKEVYVISFNDEQLLINKLPNLLSNEGLNILLIQEDKPSVDEISFIKNMFFSMYINYSLYGLDDQDFAEKEDEVVKEMQLDGIERLVYISWLTKIFHKNDGYQTPLVIHPFRRNAMINVRNEKHLMENRLASLLFTNPEYRTLIPGFEFDTIGFHLKEFALNKYLRNLLETQSPSINLSEIVNLRNLTDDKVNKIIDCLSDWVEHNKWLLDKIFEINKVDKNVNVGQVHEVGKVLYSVQGYLMDPQLADTVLKDYYKSKGVEVQHSSYTGQNGLSNILMYVHGPLLSIEKALQDNGIQVDPKIQVLIDKLGYLSLETFASLLQLSFMYNIFLKELNLEKEDISIDGEVSNEKRYTDLKDYLFWYSVVKAIKITKRYSQYNEYSKLFDLDQFFANELRLIDEKQTAYFNSIVNVDKSHITEKFRRSMLLLHFAKNSSTESEKLIKYYSDILFSGFPFKITKEKNDFLYKNIDEIGPLIADTMQIKLDHKIEMTDLLPPPIFDYDFYGKDSDVSFSKISSGQFQKIGLLSSIVYHFKNLDSIYAIDQIYSYENANLILDEIELYFHPEQQRTFVYDLLSLLGQNKFKKIKNINIIFITHSPFILSDIPSQNVLKLKNGASVKVDDINSFGANIHDLLADEFFLKNGAMGQFAKEKIELIIDDLNQVIKSPFSTKSKKIKKLEFNKKTGRDYSSVKKKEELKYLSVIKLIGEPVLRMKLEQMYEMAFREELARFDKLIDEDEEGIIRKQILELELKLKQLNTEENGRD